jgi:hypothetical protein
MAQCCGCCLQLFLCVPPPDVLAVHGRAVLVQPLLLLLVVLAELLTTQLQSTERIALHAHIEHGHTGVATALTFTVCFAFVTEAS